MRALSVAIAALVLLACGSAREIAHQAGVPGVEVRPVVAELELRGAYIRAALASTAVSTALLFPDDPACRAILRPEVTVEYARAGRFGVVRGGGASCRAVGVASLEAWRDARPRPKLSSPRPRAPAFYEIVHDAEDHAQLRGQFPLARLLDIDGSDIVALVPKLPVCERPLSRRSASMEYCATRSPVLWLVGEGGQCPIVGLALPRDARR